MQLAAVILAAGKGTRMKSKLPKVLHKLCGRPIIDYVLDAVLAAGIEKVIVVTGYGAPEVARVLGDRAGTALQAEQLGTAHALQQVYPYIKGFPGRLLVLCGDTPLISPHTFTDLVKQHIALGASATMLTTEIPDPGGYGRVIRDEQGRVVRIVEQKDATAEELLIREVNTGIYCFDVAGLFESLAEILPANAQKEYYLTDVIGLYVRRGLVVGAVTADFRETMGINDRRQLAAVEAVMRRQVLDDLMDSGVTVIDPASTFVDRQVRIGQDTVVYPFTFVEGKTVIGEDCVIGPGARLVNARIGNNVTIQHSIITDSEINDGASVGPFACIRPETVIGRGVRVGNFVEVKKSVIGNNSKVPHLSYVGDATIGENVNIGAGTITCNYDGENKWPTRIGDGAFVGSNTNLVAPVEVGPGAIIGAGSTITKDVPAGALGVERARQSVIPNWAAKKKKR
ncbi:MAG: bifunctional UDP-N-acetylglucosamine diphosphorylase/glucosamine-1-phosphate N-acetyltransferase GlmU [Peptococcaceae bacterium]|nr:MAG: bifunctional UDP-N-acetylglucosamine diphosphorylase/glucosamine-1-phosphate N-acetyltransferase GlmU [Peptococcaceae bacterium]